MPHACEYDAISYPATVYADSDRREVDSHSVGDRLVCIEEHPIAGQVVTLHERRREFVPILDEDPH